MILSYAVNINPLGWRRAGLSRGKTFYDTQKLDKEAYKCCLQQQHGDNPLFSGPVSITGVFFMDIAHHKKLKEGDWFPFFPDNDNLQKHLFDCFKGIIMVDDRLIAHVDFKKIASKKPRTEFTITSL